MLKFRIFYIILNRVKLKRKSCVTIGTNSRIFNEVYLQINSLSSVKIGNNFVFSSGLAFNPLSRNIKGCIHTEAYAQLIIGDNVGMSSTCIWCNKKISIGNNVKIGSDCIILDSDCHSLDFKDRRNDLNEHNNDKDIYIQDDVMIGAKCIILKGVTIGRNSVIGSGSIVTKNIPDNCIAAGNPCKIIRKLNF